MRAFILVRNQVNYPWQAIMEGVRACGDKAIAGYHNDPLDAQCAVVTWNDYGLASHVAGRARKAGGKHIVFENGYVAREDGFYAVGLNGVNGNDAQIVKVCGATRWSSLGVPMYPWRYNHDGYILVCGQRGGGYNMMAMPNEWPQRILEQLRHVTDRKILYRPHPERARLPESLPSHTCVVRADMPIDYWLQNAFACVVYTSNAATDALLQGVPVFYDGPTIACAALAQRGIQTIDKPVYPDREPFFWALAYRQWHEDEIKRGLPWRCLAH